MKNLNEMTAKELKEIAKEMKISNWWNLKKAVLIEKIEEAQNMTEEEKQEIADQKAKEDKLFEHYSKNWAKYGPKNDWVKFLEKYNAGKIELVEDIFGEETEVEEQQVEEDNLVSMPGIDKLEELKNEYAQHTSVDEEVKPFVYTDEDGTEWEDYEIGEKIKNWSEKKKAAFTEVYNGLDDFDVDKWSKEWDKEHYGIEPKDKPTPKRGALIEWNGKAQNICKWGEELGISPNTLYGRIYKMGWSIEKAFTTRPR